MSLHPRILTALFAFFIGVASAHALAITHTEPRRFDKVPFTRLGDLFGHPTPDPLRLTLFSDPARHAGLFFDVTLDTKLSQVPTGTTALVEVLFEGDKTAREIRFTIPENKNNSKNLYLGLTDESLTTMTGKTSAKTKSSLHLLAWKISLLDSAGKTLSAAPSPLWQY